MTTTRKASDDEITQAMMSGITFKGAKLKKATAEAKVKTKAKKKTYYRPAWFRISEEKS